MLHPVKILTLVTLGLLVFVNLPFIVNTVYGCFIQFNYKQSKNFVSLTLLYGLTCVLNLLEEVILWRTDTIVLADMADLNAHSL
jgi:hypothetical protein